MVSSRRALSSADDHAAGLTSSLANLDDYLER